ncbi:hypothetical protein [Wenzhouxiangella sp. EGI_FJ10305]|uniref:hypothetical protein n=1 Tax=Wenzhouxiangella sp. EGI_FJ10305 TaxID=3243768 RepID=UPI0035DC37EB
MSSSILWLIGPALGHVSRSCLIAEALKANWHVEVTFVGNDKFGYIKELLPPDFKFIEVEHQDSDGFSAAVEKVIRKLGPSVICLDCSPIPWLETLSTFDIPTVYLTNYFLTRLGDAETYQDQVFRNRSDEINERRESKGLPMLDSARDLYDRDKIILLDPMELISHKELSTNYFPAGICSWELNVAIPAELRRYTRLLFVSTGSTGRGVMPPKLLNGIARVLNAEKTVLLGTRQRSDNYSAEILCYKRLPARRVLERSVFCLTHGGTGSVYQSLTARCPVGIWPGHRNHRILGSAVKNRGLGMYIDSADSIERELLGLERNLAMYKSSLSKLTRTNSDLNAAYAAQEIVKFA